MLEFLSAHVADLVIGAVIVAVVALVSIKMIRDKKKHVSSCGGSCADCPMHGKCH